MSRPRAAHSEMSDRRINPPASDPSATNMKKLPAAGMSDVKPERQ
jgi:hypothetical protein